MTEDIASINSSPDVFTFADKTNNIQQAPPEQYKKLLKKSVSKTYKKWKNSSKSQSIWKRKT